MSVLSKQSHLSLSLKQFELGGRLVLNPLLLQHPIGWARRYRLTPAQLDLTIYTDSAAAIWAVKGFDKLSPGRRMRLGSRPVVIALARLIAARSGTTTIRHVRSHTGETNYRSQGNDRADQLANDAREHGRDAPLQPMLEGEGKVVF